MVIVRINPLIPSFVIIDREKETVRLGEYCNQTGALTQEAMQRGYNTLARFLTLARTHDVESVIAVATSAVREAPNGQEFLTWVQEGLGLTIDLISGQEEARRIYLGVISAVELQGQPHVMVDIGGGSTELILGDGREPMFLRSVKIGAVRLTQHFLHHDPPAVEEVQALRAYIQGMIEAPIEQIKHLLGPLPVQMIGTSGTIETLAVLTNRREQTSPPQRPHGLQLSLKGLSEFTEKICTLPLAERLKIPGLVERRAEIILAGALILQEIMEHLGAKQIHFCSRSLREGLIVDWMLTQGLIEDRLRYQSSVRQRNVLKLAYKYQVEMPYAERVADFAVSLFDQTQGILHHWGDPEREYLWVAAILHNCGHFVSHSAHHKHSYYLIRHGDLLGFNEEEMELIANLARYHRKSVPKKRHENFQRLASEEHKQVVLELSPLLRLASALDRRRIHAIQGINCEFIPKGKKPSQLRLLLQATRPEDDCALELWSLANKKSVMEQQFQIQIETVLQAPLVMQR
jgi:exopolyphosphatase/guanosine-5'-triphosphate,3'-diphosphate pyrophosphatase